MPSDPQVAKRQSQLIIGPNGGIETEIPRPVHPTPPPVLTYVQRLERSRENPSGLVDGRPWHRTAADDKRAAKYAPREEWAREPEYELTPIEASFRHGGWHSRRQRVAAALSKAGVSSRRQCNFAQCGANAYVFVERKTGQIRLEASYCKDRFCQPCQQARATRIALALQERAPLHKCLHVVLTLTSSAAPLGEQLTKLFKSSSRLRQSRFWKSHVIGGSQTFEVTRNSVSGQWHPHLHLLVHADWLAHEQLSAEWHKATGDSFIVHVSLVQNHTAAVREVTKYLGKPIHRSIDFDQPSLVELILQLKGRRLIGTFGTWRNDPLLKDDYEDDAGQWERWGTLLSLHAKASAGDVWAREALKYLSSLVPGRERQPPPPVPPSG